MTQRTTVVGKRDGITKPQLHALLMMGWSRAIANLGKGGFADALEASTVAIDKHASGSMPGFDLIDRAFDVEPSVLDDWLSRKGKRIVDEDAICDADDAKLVTSRLLTKIIEATQPGSPGGERIIHSELLDMEPLIREMHRITGNWLEEAAKVRGYSLRSVA